MLVDFAQIPFTWVRLADFAPWADPQDPVNVLSRLPPPQSRKHNTSTVCGPHGPSITHAGRTVVSSPPRLSRTKV